MLAVAALLSGMALLTAPCNIGRMAEYKIVLDGRSGFGVEVTSANQYQSVRGFPTETNARIWIVEHQASAATRIVEVGTSKPGEGKMRYQLRLLGKSSDTQAAETFLADDDVGANDIARAIFSACCDNFDGYEVWNGKTMISRGRGAQQVGYWWQVTQASQRAVLDLEDRMQRTLVSLSKSKQLLDATAKLRVLIASESDPLPLSRPDR
jgi:hypothetical protein